MTIDRGNAVLMTNHEGTLWDRWLLQQDNTWKQQHYRTERNSRDGIIWPMFHMWWNRGPERGNKLLWWYSESGTKWKLAFRFSWLSMWCGTGLDWQERGRQPWKSCSSSWFCAPRGCSLIIHYPHLGVLDGVPWPAFDPHLGVFDGDSWPASPLHLGLLGMDSHAWSSLSGASEVRYLRTWFPYSPQQLTHLPSSPQPWLTITRHLFLLIKFSFGSPAFFPN